MGFSTLAHPIRRFLVFIALAASLGAWADSNSVQVDCNNTERSLLFFPRGRETQSTPTHISEAMICSTLDHALAMNQQAYQQLNPIMDLAALGDGLPPPADSHQIKSSISPRCWRSVAQFWDKADADKSKWSQRGAIDFLKHDLGSFISSFEAPLPEGSDSPDSAASGACYLYAPPQKEFLGNIQSAQNVLAKSLQSLKCSDEDSREELEKWARLELRYYYDSSIYDDCRTSAKTELLSLKNCQAQRAQVIARLSRTLGSSPVTYGSCLAAVGKSNPSGSSWRNTSTLCGIPSLSAYEQSRKTFSAMGDTGSLLELNQRYGRCGGVVRECRNLNASAVERNDGLCSLPLDMGKQTAGTCGFHALAAAIYIGDKSCPKSPGKLYSIGELQSFSGQKNWQSESPLNSGTLLGIQKSLNQRGIHVAESNDPLSTLSRRDFPLVISAKVGDLRQGWSDASYAKNLITTPSEDNAQGSEGGFHALLVTDVITEDGKKVAIIRDAGDGYRPLFIPLDRLIQASQYFKESCASTGGCPPPILRIER